MKRKKNKKRKGGCPGDVAGGGMVARPSITHGTSRHPPGGTDRKQRFILPPEKQSVNRTLAKQMHQRAKKYRYRNY